VNTFDYIDVYISLYLSRKRTKQRSTI